jgi:DNA-binding response OmpR family regulator
MRVLIIEPDKILANNLNTIFMASGFETAVFFDPQLAVEDMDKQLPDIIILELQLAPLSGIAFLYELRGYDDFGQVPVVIYSSVPKETFGLDEKQLNRLGIIKYFYKAKISGHKVASFAKGALG